MKKKEMYQIPDESLSKYMDIGLLSPFAVKNSVARLDMINSGIKHAVIPAINPERPLIDSIYTKDILQSSDNYKTSSQVELIKKIEKNINGVISERTYIYRDLSDGLVYVENVPLYMPYYRFGYESASELENLEEGETSKSSIFTKHVKTMDPTDGGIAFGKNINFIYSICRAVGEDSIIISKDLAEDLSVNYVDEVSFTYSVTDQVLKDMYGFVDTNGNYNYRPFPLPGEDLKDGVVACISPMGRDFLASSDHLQEADQVYYLHGGKVYDIEVWSNSVIDNDYLENLRLIQRQYIRDIADALNVIPITSFTDETKILSERYNALLGTEYRVGKNELKKKVFIRIKVANKNAATIGTKLTNRHGGKGTISAILDEPFIAEDGTKIHMLINATGIINRENPAQLFEKGLNELNIFLRKYLTSTKDSTEVKYNNICKWVEIANQPKLLETIMKFKKEEIVTYYTENFFVLKYDPGMIDMPFSRYVDLTRFTNTLYPVMASKIFFKGKELSEKHMYGHAFYLRLENDPYKDTHIRTDGILNVKGTLSKKGEDKKKHHTKSGTTAVKISDLGVNITLNRLFTTDASLLRNNTDSLSHYLSVIGIQLKLSKKEGEDK